MNQYHNRTLKLEKSKSNQIFKNPTLYSKSLNLILWVNYEF